MNSKTLASFEFVKQQVLKYAKQYKWEQRQVEKNEGVVQMWFTRDGVMMMVEPKTRTVVTHMDHKGKKKILRRTSLFITEMKSIFENPRIHTGKGRQLKIKKPRT